MPAALTLCDRSTDMVQAWKRYFLDESGVKVVNQNILTLPIDALAVPANAFGFTDGGVDLAISKEIFDWRLQDRLRAPGDFAQAYVIAHEVGHHVQNLIGATQRSIPGETQNQTSVRVELQADCFAGVWGHTAQAQLAIDESDLREALNAAHSIGDDTLGASEAQYTHGTSAQRMTWFRRGFDSGDARQCDTFAVRNYNQL